MILFENQTNLKFNALFIIRKTFNPIFRFRLTDSESILNYVPNVDPTSNIKCGT